MTAVRRAAACLVCCLAGLAVVPVVALGEGVAIERLPSVKRSGASLALAGPLVIVGSLTAGEEPREWAEAKRDSPGAFAVRERSRTRYEGLGAQAARVDRAVFPGLIDDQAGGTPLMPTGVRLVRYSGPTTAQLALPGGRHGALESTSVIAKPAADGHFVPVELGLERSGKEYRPKAPAVAVNIPERLSEGVTAPASGVSLVPINSRGVPLYGSQGSLQGASVLYVNSQTDTDTVAKPTTAGFELGAILRSARSPHTLYYRVRMPREARLVQRPNGQVEVIGGHGRIGSIPSPVGQDASGAAVPVTMNVAGNTLVVKVDDATDETQWPIEIDPEYWEDDKLSPGWSECPVDGVCTYGMHNWKFITSNEHIFEMDISAAYWWPVASYNGGEYAGIQYETQGESKIWAFETKTITEFGYNIDANIDLIKPNGKGSYEYENELPLSNGETSKEATICGDAHTEGHLCETTEGYSGNIARFMTDTTASGTEHSFVAKMEVGHVYISQEKGPEVSFNATSPTIMVNGTTRPNVLYGSGAWLSPVSGAVGVSANDPGVGVSAVKLTSSSSLQEVNIHREGKCWGLRCEKTYIGSFTYSPRMENGEHSFRLTGEDGVDATGSTEATIKVDASKPYKLGFTGMSDKGAEISAAPHTLTVYATDGKKPTPSSGIRSISVSIDGGTPTELSGASCPEGECKASGEYTLHAENLSEGVHRLTVNAVSNSGEPEAKEFLFDVRHASPVSVGPGAVDPTTGQFTLTADDVSLGGASGVSRSYQSRNLTAGASGPLGPQWAMSVGGGEGLVVLPSGDVALISGTGGQTTFTLNAEGEFEAPKGDENLTIEHNTTEHKYVLKDANAGSETIFEQPAGTQSTAPAYGSSFGAEAGVLSRPIGEALDASGDVWVTDGANDRIAEFSKAGTLIATYGSEGTEAGQFEWPAGIAVNQKTGNVYVTEVYNHRIDEFSSSGAFIRMIGWGVSNDEAKLETCTSSCMAGIAGAGEGQLDYPHGLAIDSSGNLWVTEEGSDRVQEFSESGAYLGKFGSAGTGAGQFGDPTSITIAGGDFYIADQGDNRIAEFSTGGAFVKAIGWGVSNGEAKLETCTSSCQDGIAGSGSGQFDGVRGVTADPVSGNLYVVEATNDRVQELTTAGAFVTKFGSGGSGPGQFAAPREVVVSPTGAIYVTDYEHASVQEWMRTTWFPTSAKGALPTRTTYTYTSVEGSEGTSSMQPYEVVSPAPQGVECGTKPEELKEEKDKGCRALTFKYSAETSATGEKESEWGEYKGHLHQVIFHAYNPSTEAMEEKAVAQYSYDKQGRLRAEWDPRIEASTACGKTCSALKTTYGYDLEGHVTALTRSGQQPWAFTYGTIAGDPDTGRLLKVTQAYPKAAWSEEEVRAKLNERKELPTKKEAPKLSGSPIVGATMGVSSGVWGNSPFVYGYQWEDCSSEGSSCTPILGATNANYEVATSDVGQTLVVEVEGTNGGGSTLASSAASSVVTSSGTKVEGEAHTPEPGATIEYNVPVSGSGAPYPLSKGDVEKWGQKDISKSEDNDPVEGMAVFPPDEPQSWPASDYKRATIDYINSKGLTVNTAAPTGGITTTEYNELNEKIRMLSADNRAVAMKEGCKSVKEECRSAEVAEKLDTKVEYNALGNDILKELGPEHEVKLSTGEEVEARAVTHNYYNQGAEEAEEKNKEAYNLVTETTSGALLSDGEEKDVRTETMSYGGQEDLGWKLRKPTSTTLEPAGLDLVHKTFYEPDTGNVTETRTPGGNSEQVSPPSFSLHFGGSGSGNGQLKEPWGIALDSSGNVLALDSGNDRVEKFSSTGGFDAAYGKEGTGALKFNEPEGIAVNEITGDVYVSDSKNNRIEELNSAGEFVEVIGWGVRNEKAELQVCKVGCKAGLAGSGNGELSTPIGIAIDSKGDIWVVDSGNDRVQEFSESGSYLAQFGSKGSGDGELMEPAGIAISEGSVYVVDHGNNRIEQFSMAGAYMGQFGNKGSGPGQFDEPYGITANQSTGALYVCDMGNERMQEFSPAGKFLTEWGTWGSTHEQSYPRGVAVGSTGDLYIIDHSADEVGEWIPPEAGGAHLSYDIQFGSKGTGDGQLNEPVAAALDGKGDVWVSDFANDRIEKFNPDGSFLASYGKEGSGEVEFDGPSGIAINKSTGDIYIADERNNRVEELSSSGAYLGSFGTFGSGTLKEPEGIAVDSSGNVWVVDHGNSRIVEFSSTGTYIAAYGEEGSGEDEFNHPSGIVVSGEDVYVSDPWNHRVEELTTSGAYVRAWGVDGNGSGEFWSPEGIATDAAGNLYVVDYSADHIEEFSPTGAYKATFASPGSGEGQLTHPIGVATDAANDLYVVDSGDDRVERWDSNEQAAHDTQTVYYSAEANSTYPNCGKHPEWADLVCQTQPAAQPDRGLPELPVSTVASYNIWDDVEKTEEKFGTGSKAVTRAKTETYDPAGRAVTSEESAQNEKKEPVNTVLPKVTDEYNAETGALERQSTSEGMITSKDNTLGQQIEYKDASGNVAKYTYEEGGDGRLDEVSEGKGEEARSSQTYSYNTTTGFMEKLVDSAAGTFKASYDVEGKMTSETYPNNMTATTTYNSLGQATNLVYEKNADCASKCPETWFSDSIVPSIHGETLEQTSTLATENYAYDNAGRLLETQETPAGKGCTTRLYAYDEESNRTSETTREPGTEGKCATEGGIVERHIYDEASRLTDEGVEYETLGNTTKMPSSDAGGHEIMSTYYVDNQVASEEQKRELLGYKYDPLGRTVERTSENEETKAKSNVISHYAGAGNALTWTCEEEGKEGRKECSEGTGKWSRNIPGIDGALDAIEEDGRATVLQLHDLQGDIVGTVEDNETVTKLASTYNSIEFGVPNEGKTPPKYAWLGAEGVSSEPSLGSGTSIESGASYVPQVARTLQTAPVVPPGAFPNGSPGTQFTATVSPGLLQFAQEEATQIWQRAEAERQKAREEEARKRREELAVGAEDPKRNYFLIDPEEVKELSEDLELLATRSQLIGLAISVIPGIGEAASIAGETYGAYLELWASAFDSLFESMEKEWNSTKRYPDVYRVTEYYASIPLLGHFPETFGPTEQCVFIEWHHENTRYECASGEWEVRGMYY